MANILLGHVDQKGGEIKQNEVVVNDSSGVVEGQKKNEVPIYL